MARKKTTKRASKQKKNRQKRSVFAYPLVIFLLLCAGIFLIAWTLRAGAANIFVTAKVAATPVTQPANITSPADGTHFSSIPITVKGTCPANAAYVEIFSNGTMRGTAICDVSNSFELSVDLSPGTNSLTAHVFNVTDDEGPISAPVTVIYDVPQLPGGTGQQKTTGKPTHSPVVLTTAFLYRGFHAGDQVEWPIDISGGSAPYAVSVDWGDGNTDLISRSQAGEFKIDHTYSQSGGFKNSYTIKIKASDAGGQTAYLQFFVIVTKDTKQSGVIFSKPPPSFAHGLSWLWLAWPLYLLILLMALSYRLGEKEELIILRKRGALKR
jgi:hypothetical protein